MNPVLFRKTLKSRVSPAAAGGAIKKRAVKIDHTKCGSSDSTNYTVLVSISDTTLKTVANGGHVYNSSGYDIVFYSDSGYTAIMNWEVEFYDGVNGILVARVLNATVSHTADTPFYMKYGDSSISSFQGGTLGAAWNSGFKLVHHYANGTTLSVLDATSNANNGINSGAGAGAGKIDGAATFIASNANKIVLAKNLNQIIGSSATWTVTMWFAYNDTVINTYGAFLYDFETGSSFSGIQIMSNWMNIGVGGGSTYRHYTPSFAINTWNKLTVEKTAAGNLGNVYANGTLLTPYTNSGGGWGNLGSGGTGIIGNFHSTNDSMAGAIDELKISNVARGADWETTEYNNENNPGNIGAPGFLTFGAETT